MSIINTFINGPVGLLEARYNINNPNKWAIISHPNPLYKGSMHNKVITCCTKSCDQANISWIIFNFRGVGKSEGEYAGLNQAVLDANYVVKWLLSTNKTPTWAIGFSFGAYVAQTIANQYQIKNLIMLAPALKKLTPHKLTPTNTNIIHGTEDSIAKIEHSQSWAKDKNNCNLIVMNNTGHFFHGKLPCLQQNLLNILNQE